MNKELLKMLYTLIDKDCQIARLSATTEGEAKLASTIFEKIKENFKMVSEFLPKE